MTECTTQEQWAIDDCDEGPSVWECPTCGELYSEADAALAPDGRAECPYCWAEKEANDGD